MQIRFLCFYAVILMSNCWSHPLHQDLFDKESESDPFLFWLPASRSVAVCPTEASGFAGGDGSEGNPYQICNIEQLQNIKNSLTENFVFTSDIDASDTVNWNSGEGFEPIGSTDTIFSGSVNGARHTIHNLYINRTIESDVGLFGYVDGARIENIQLENVNISGGAITGGLIGRSFRSTFLENSVTGSITGDGVHLGGFAGILEIDSRVERSWVNVQVLQTSSLINAGGFAGVILEDALVRDCYSLGTVQSNTATSKVGGFVGHGPFNDFGGSCTPGGTIVNVFAAMTSITAPATDEAGLSGQSQGCIVVNSYCVDTIDNGNDECRNQNTGSFSGGRRTIGQLQCATSPGENCSGNSTYVGWSSDVWDFRSSGELPVLRWQNQ